MKTTRTAAQALPSHPALCGETGANQPPAKPSPHPGVGPFFTVQQIAERHPAFTVRTLRHWIFNAANRRAWKDRQAVVIPGNGFDRVIVRKGRRVFINEAALFAWLARDPVSNQSSEK
jgi:hypothetical protein